jgi:hypothetical protein
MVPQKPMHGTDVVLHGTAAQLSEIHTIAFIDTLPLLDFVIVSHKMYRIKSQPNDYQ